MVHNGKDPSPFPILGLNKDKVYAGFYESDLEELKIPIDIMTYFANHRGDRAATIRYTIEKGYRSKEWMTERKIDRFGVIHSPRKIGGEIFDWDKIIRLLANPKYRGVNYFVDVFDQYPDLQNDDGIVRWEYSHRRKYGDIIDPKLLEEVDQYLEPPNTRPRQNDYFMAGVLFGPFAEEAKSGQHPYYYNRGVRKRFPREHIHQLVFEKLKQYLVDFGIIERLIKSMAKEKEFGLPKLQEQRKEIKSNLERLERAKSNFSEIIKKAAVANDDKLVEVVNSLSEEKRRSEGEIVELTHRLKELDVEEQQFLKNLDGSSLKHFLELTLNNFDKPGAVERKQVVQALIPKAEILIEESGDILLKLFISLNPLQESSLHDPKLRAQEDKSWPFIKIGRGGANVVEPTTVMQEHPVQWKRRRIDN